MVPIESRVFVKDTAGSIFAVQWGARQISNNVEYVLTDNEINSVRMYTAMGGKYVTYCDYLGNNEAPTIKKYRELVPQYT